MDGVFQLAALAARPVLRRQHDLLVRLQRLLHDESSCLGAAVGGSLAGTIADELSDVDLVVYCEVGAARRLLRVLSAEAADGPVVYRLCGEHDGHSVYEKVILADWSSYEIHVIEPGTKMRLRPPYVEILDRHGYLRCRVSADKPIGRQALRPFVNGEAGLIWELFNCIKWLRRGQVDVTVQHLRALGTALDAATDESNT